MEPTFTVIKKLSSAQLREIAALQEEVQVTSQDKHRVRVLRSLVLCDIALYPDPEDLNTFLLADPWMNAVLDLKKLKEKSQKELDAAKAAERRAKHEALMAGVSKFIPDPPKGEFIRPPAVYSNKNWEQNINEILAR